MSARKATVILTPEAEEDFEDIYQYTSDHWGDDRASVYVEALRASLQRLADFPKLGRSRGELRPGRRSHRVKQHVIHYRIDGDRVTILRILHVRFDAAFRSTDKDDEAP